MNIQKRGQGGLDNITCRPCLPLSLPSLSAKCWRSSLSPSDPQHSTSSLPSAVLARSCLVDDGVHRHHTSDESCRFWGSFCRRRLLDTGAQLGRRDRRYQIESNRDEMNPRSIHRSPRRVSEASAVPIVCALFRV